MTIVHFRNEYGEYRNRINLTVHLEYFCWISEKYLLILGYLVVILVVTLLRDNFLTGTNVSDEYNLSIFRVFTGLFTSSYCVTVANMNVFTVFIISNFHIVLCCKIKLSFEWISEKAKPGQWSYWFWLKGRDAGICHFDIIVPALMISNSWIISRLYLGFVYSRIELKFVSPLNIINHFIFVM